MPVALSDYFVVTTPNMADRVALLFASHYIHLPYYIYHLKISCSSATLSCIGSDAICLGTTLRFTPTLLRSDLSGYRSGSG